jgi:hypothetical protein
MPLREPESRAVHRRGTDGGAGRKAAGRRVPATRTMMVLVGCTGVHECRDRILADGAETGIVGENADATGDTRMTPVLYLLYSFRSKTITSLVLRE